MFVPSHVARSFSRSVVRLCVSVRWPCACPKLFRVRRFGYSLHEATAASVHSCPHSLCEHIKFFAKRSRLAEAAKRFDWCFVYTQHTHTHAHAHIARTRRDPILFYQPMRKSSPCVNLFPSSSSSSSFAFVVSFHFKCRSAFPCCWLPLVATRDPSHMFSCERNETDTLFASIAMKFDGWNEILPSANTSSKCFVYYICFVFFFSRQRLLVHVWARKCVWVSVWTLDRLPVAVSHFFHIFCATLSDELNTNYRLCRPWISIFIHTSHHLWRENRIERTHTAVISTNIFDVCRYSGRFL